MPYIKSVSDIRIIEREGKDVFSDRLTVSVSSHWSNSGYVVIEVPGVEGTITVEADGLRRAIQNATNC